MNTSLKALLSGAAGLLTLAAHVAPAAACGGFFCSTAQPVNQAAERIVFADNGDGTVTAVIQIQYEGPSESFSWLLPISTAPQADEIKVASDLAFQRLQGATNPQYILNTRIEGTCLPSPPSAPGGSLPPLAADSGDVSQGGGNVNVEASGSVGPFDWTVISVADGADEPAQDAVTWLKDNGYDIPDSAPGLLGPYLEDGLFLLALRLTKGADTGSIRPIVLTYDADKPIIPVKLTSVAANDDMGVMTWLLGDGRGVPENYQALELNEARINWFNAASNYNQVVTEAANDAQGQGFVTEFAGPSEPLAEVVWSIYEETRWEDLSTTQYDSFDELFNTLFYAYGSFDGFWNAVQASVTFSASVNFEDFKSCPSCYTDQIEFSPAELFAAVEENVIDPMRVVQRLINAHPTVTRLYTTLSAEEMTIDPIFTFNKELPDLSNIHTADRVIECSPDVTQFDAPWRIELPNGGVIRGTASDLSSATSGTWPEGLAALPANQTIMRQASTGEGKVLEDNETLIETELAAYNERIAPGSSTAAPTTDVPGNDVPANDPPTNGGSENDGPKQAVDATPNDADGGCNVGSSSTPASGNGHWGWLALGALVLTRRRAKSSRGPR